MKKFAVLIDADNSSHRSIELILTEIAKYGTASVKRIYGDWSVESLKNWRDILLPHAITPVQQFAYVTQKDSTDMKLVIDAMDLLYAGELDGFCIISSDSDFTPLASRIRESGLLCYGFGKKNTVDSFKNACDKFIYVENLEKNKQDKNKIKEIAISETIVEDEIKQLINKAVKDNTEDNGWANMAIVGQYINNVRPDFDPRTYERSSLSSLMKMLGTFEMKVERSQMYVKKFNFIDFNKYVQKTITRLDANNEWQTIADVAKFILLDKDNEENYSRFTQNELEIKIRSIHKNWIEFSEDLKMIRNLTEIADDGTK